MKEWLDAVCHIAKEAGEAIMPYFNKTPCMLQTRKKADSSPVTDADIAAHNIIESGLKALAPNVPLLSEEDKQQADFATRTTWKQYWLVDPLDGTRGFIAGMPEFSVNIALIEDHKPVMGVIYHPTTRNCYYAYDNAGAFKLDSDENITKLQAVVANNECITFAVGQYHNHKRIAQLAGENQQFKLLKLNSSLKFTALAEGRADVYVRLGPTGEWDTAAGQCILCEAGGKVVDLDGNSMQYNARESVINGAFVAFGDTQLQDRIFATIKRSLRS